MLAAFTKQIAGSESLLAERTPLLRSNAASASGDTTVPSEVALSESGRVTVRSTGVSLLTPARFSPLIAWSIGVLGLVWVFGILVVAGKRTADPRSFPVNEVEVAGTLDYTDRDQLRSSVVEHSNSGFYSLDLEAVRSDVTRLPWVSEAHVQRISPDRLSIDVIEHEPAARWNSDALISKRFELFSPPQLAADSVQRAEWAAYFSQFPQLRGAAGRHEPVLAAFRRYQGVLDQHGVEIIAVLEDDRHSQTVVLENEVSVRLGSTDQGARIQRFSEIYHLLVPQFKGQAVKFDMRYRNGFAVTNPGSPRAVSNIEAAAQSTRSAPVAGEAREEKEEKAGEIEKVGTEGRAQN